MRTRTRLSIGAKLGLGVCAALFVTGMAAMAADDANVAGSWQMTFQGRQGPVNQTLTIEQDGGKIKGTLKGQRGEAPLEGSIKGNDISFTVKRTTPRGEMVLQYKGTVDGDSMKGTFEAGGGNFNGDWTAKKGKE